MARRQGLVVRDSQDCTFGTSSKRPQVTQPVGRLCSGRMNHAYSRRTTQQRIDLAPLIRPQSSETSGLGGHRAQKRLVPARIRRGVQVLRRLIDEVPSAHEREAGAQLVRNLLDGDDPHWWILAGGIYVPGFGIGNSEASGADQQNR
jgi:hypothetical protein